MDDQRNGAHLMTCGHFHALIGSVAAGGCSCTPAYVTGDRRASITVTTSGHTVYNGPASDIIDGSTANGSGYWTTDMTNGAWIKFDWGAGVSIKITEAKWYVSSAGGSHGTWKWQGSNDDSSYTDIGSSFTLGGAGMTTQTELSSNTNGYRYYRLYCVTAANPGSTWTEEVEFKQCTC